MVELSQNQIDSITNAMLVGMTRSDALVYAGLTPQQIAAISDDELWMAKFHKMEKDHEYGLLVRLNRVIEKQERAGKDSAVTWALEHMYPRYSNKPQEEGKQIIINFGEKDPATDKERVELHS